MTGTDCRRCRRKAQRERPRKGGIGAVAVAAALLAASLAIVFTSRPPPGPAVIPHRAWRICPVPDCSAYPRPAAVQGITISSLQGYLLYLKSAEAQIHAASRWQATTIRLQVEQDKLVGADGRGLNRTYAKAVREVARYALLRGFYVVINAQTEDTVGYAANEPLPTAATYAFWAYFTKVYGTFPRVVFDLFNEPRDCSWQQWRAAFQPLLAAVRKAGSVNQIWIEGRAWGSTLQGVPFLAGQGVVYSYHHPGCPHQYQCPVSSATWWQAFGQYAARGVPVVNGEFVNFTGGYVWDHATQRVTRYLLLLRRWHIGVIAWSLQPGVMTTGLDLTRPIAEPQGAGALVWRDFHHQLVPQAAPALAEGGGR